MDSRWLLVVTLFSTASFVHAYSCTYSWNGVNYDASPLANSNTDYHFQVQTTDFWINVCRPTVTQVCGSSSATCEQWDPNSANGHASLGNAGTATFNPPSVPGENGQGFTVQFTGGDKPPGQNNPRTMEIDFICDHSAGVGVPSYAGEQPALHYNFQWRSSYACAATPPPPPSCAGTSCGGCLANATGQCVWCLDSGSCSSMANFNASCTNWVTKPQYCPAPACSQQATCAGCVGVGGCSWCLDTASCVVSPSNPSICADTVSNVTYCPTGDYEDFKASKIPTGKRMKVVN
eukprot:TRINITY_DN1152_c0_g2_i1.p1 TRINITY_DN1152_c0_g2~~TRINITY_DN1152_c0_g2_i1.p1  ORF type:complete len:291 (-),score=25.86 TRINITY_DN1152_c0_g2_i1:209-1081(-)